jgi:hypothetical protein
MDAPGPDDPSLRESLRAMPPAPWEARLRHACFVLGLRCARHDRQLPAWIEAAPLWAVAAARAGAEAWRARARQSPAA